MRVVKEHAVRKAEILSAAYELFVTKGYERTSVQDVIDKTDIAKGTLYHYFKSKEEILDAVTEQMMDVIVKQVKAIMIRQKAASLIAMAALRIAFFSTETAGDISPVFREIG